MAVSILLAAATGCSATAPSGSKSLIARSPTPSTSTLPRSAPTKPPSPAADGASSGSARTVTPFSSDLRVALAKRPGHVSAVVEQISSGRQWTLNPGLRAYSASIVKVPILLAALRRARQQGTGLSASQRATATAMIERSDNTAATKLWRYAGGSAALSALFSTLHMTSTTTRSSTLFEPWDGVQTSASDQVRLLRAILDGVPGVSPPDLRFVLGLMASVEANQRWGVPVGTPAAATAVVKNGWVPVGASGWTVNTIGVVQDGEETYALAVLSTGSPSEAAGITAVNMVARAVAHTRLSGR